MRQRLAAAGALTAAAALALTACGSSPTPTAGGSPSASPTPTPSTGSAAPADPAVAAWSDAFCGGMVSVITGGKELEGRLSSATPDPAALTRSLTTYADTTVASLRDTKSRLETLGAPGPEMQELHASALSAYDAGAQQAEQVATSVAALDGTAPDFGTKVLTVVTQMADFSTVQAAITSVLTDQKIAAQLDSSPQCVTLKDLAGA
ncbi:hypothetical protein [Umezawaea beigongshangensis]|uniref:hypothetical protein n=1 Tax=Umezawaea beigongshangensis TaxID=2780383 RepID=UPI0018F16D46|nr:hypothetical protein [Umezawaea beigongshangensis]